MDFLMSMSDAVLNWLANGLLGWNGWEIVLFTLLATHITIAAVTIFLHRAQAHRALELHGLPAHFFRFWLWLTTGMVTKEWVAIHRKHHAKCETEDDPHSPQTRGINTVLLTGSELYRTEAKNQETLAKFGHGTPDDWLERNLYIDKKETSKGVGHGFDGWLSVTRPDASAAITDTKLIKIVTAAASALSPVTTTLSPWRRMSIANSVGSPYGTCSS